jgi:protein-disulfide isomerase
MRPKAANLISLCAVAASAGLVVYSLRSQPAGARETAPTESAVTLPAELIDISTAFTVGDMTAPVAIIEFADFECAACGMFARSTAPELKRRYIDSGRVVWAYRHLPLDRLHPNAPVAAAAAHCAGRSNKFWEMHDVLFAHQGALDRLNIDQFANELGIATEAFTECLGQEGPGAVKEDVITAAWLGINNTPTFLLGYQTVKGKVMVQRVIRGARPIDEFAEVLDSLIGTTSRR